MSLAFILRQLKQGHATFNCSVSSMNKDHDLMAFSDKIQDFVETYFIHIIVLLISVECFDPNKGLSQGHGSKSAVKKEQQVSCLLAFFLEDQLFVYIPVKEKQSDVRIDPKKLGNIDVVW